MTPLDLSSAIARWLSGMWDFHRSEPFATYVASTYGKKVDRLPSFDCVYIAEAESGNMDTGQIGGIIKKWWMVDNAGVVEMQRPQLPLDDDSALFDRRPILKFVTDGERVIFGERLGPNLVCRKVGRLVIKTGGTISVTDVQLLWTA